MTSFTLPHDAPDVVRPFGWGIAACDHNGKLREIPGTVPLKPRSVEPASFAAVVRGDGTLLDAIGKVDKSLYVSAPVITQEEIEQPDWFYSSHGTWPHDVTVKCIGRFVGLSEWATRRLVAIGLPVNEHSRCDVRIALDWIESKGIL
jgi:hypothetical protein